ncbi:MAG: hypothetical protein K2K70_01505 [Lachnospiraceae bacterium]|nr:hypothetical protein [Lachnospiraceae bacterium]
MKKFPYGIIVIALFSLYLLLFVSLSDIVKSEAPILTDTVYRFEKEGDCTDRWRGISIEIHYPQIQSGSDADYITNIALRDTAFSFFGDLEELTYEEVINLFQEESKDPDFIDVTKIEYEVLQCTEDYVSIIFSVEAGDGFRVYCTRYVATIDVKTGQYIHLQDVTDMEQLAQILTDNHFEVVAGTYFELHEEDVHEPEYITQYIADFENEINERDMNQPDDGVIKCSDTHRHYYLYSCKNIGMDEDYLYIYFRDSLAFEGYFIFKIPWKYIKAD